MKNKLILLLLIFLLSSLINVAQSFDIDRIPIGDTEKKYDFCKVNLDEIVNTTTLKSITEDELLKSLSEYRIVIVGETHTNQLHHDVQLAVIEGLVESGKKVILALEMFNSAQDSVLAAWSNGETDENTFIEQTGYLKTWSHNYRYYDAIFNYAREKNIPLFGVNTPRKYASKIGRGGLGALEEEDLKVLPAIDTSNIEHKFFFKVAMQGMDATMPKQFRNIYPAQCLWDAAMGEGAIKIANENPDAVVVVLAGSGHVFYNIGIGRIIKDRSDLSFASLVTVDVPELDDEHEMNDDESEVSEISDSEMKEKTKKRPARMAHMPMDLTPNKVVIRSLANFIWGKKEMEHDMYPSFGFGVRKNDGKGYPVKIVMPETIAYENGIESGDIILSIDGNDFENSIQLRKYLQYKNWDEEISFNLIREDEEIEVTFIIKPVEPELCNKKHK
ncbi:MAG: ChaN family lipoprotein [Melioribacteraceae bacterium]|nr:ChaN family lipoprotein [Melioribacteraceae bacterium]